MNADTTEDRLALERTLLGRRMMEVLYRCGLEDRPGYAERGGLRLALLAGELADLALGRLRPDLAPPPAVRPSRADRARWWRSLLRATEAESWLDKDGERTDDQALVAGVLLQQQDGNPGNVITPKTVERYLLVSQGDFTTGDDVCYYAYSRDRLAAGIAEYATEGDGWWLKAVVDLETEQEVDYRMVAVFDTKETL